MNSGPTQDDRPSSGPTPDGITTPGANVHSDSWAALARADRSSAEEILTDETETPPPQVTRARMWPRVVGVLILLVGAGGAWVWQNPGFVQNSLGSLFPGSTGQVTDTDATAIKALEARVARLEQRPDNADLAVRLDALESRGSPMQPPPPPPIDLRPILARLEALEARSRAAVSAGAGGVAASQAGAPANSDLSPIFARLDALAADHNTVSARIDAISAQLAALSGHDPTAEFRGKLDELTHKLGDLAAGEAKLSADSVHTTRLGRLVAAEIALESGHPLGTIPDAPPALARFATAAPPTEAGLRLSFTAASQAALQVSVPDTEDKPFLDRVMARLQDFRLITVREGDRVVVGNSAAAVLLRAQVLLAAGDLNGAVETVATLTGPPAEKMASWLADAKSLQEARKALAALAGNG